MSDLHHRGDGEGEPQIGRAAAPDGPFTQNRLDADTRQHAAKSTTGARNKNDDARAHDRRLERFAELSKRQVSLPLEHPRSNESGRKKSEILIAEKRGPNQKLAPPE